MCILRVHSWAAQGLCGQHAAEPSLLLALWLCSLRQLALEGRQRDSPQRSTQLQAACVPCRIESCSCCGNRRSSAHPPQVFRTPRAQDKTELQVDLRDLGALNLSLVLHRSTVPDAQTPAGAGVQHAQGGGQGRAAGGPSGPGCHRPERAHSSGACLERQSRAACQLQSLRRPERPCTRGCQACRWAVEYALLALESGCHTTAFEHCLGACLERRPPAACKLHFRQRPGRLCS